MDCPSFLTLIQQNRKKDDDPRVTEQAISQQEKLIALLRDHPGGLSRFYVYSRQKKNTETPELLASIKSLLNAGVDALALDYNLCLYNRGREVCWPLHIAAAKGFPRVTRLLLKHAGHPNIATRTGVTAAHLAVESGSAKCLKILINFGADINASTKRVCMSAEEEHTRSVMFETDSRVYSRLYLSSMNNITPLHVAAQENRLQCVRLLLYHGANVNAMDIKHRTPLYLAARWGHPKCMMMMLQHSGDCLDISTPTDSRDTALMECFPHDELMRDCIEELVYREVDVSHYNIDSVSALHRALTMLRLLKMKGRGMDFDRTEGDTALIQCFRHGERMRECIKELVYRGADVSHHNIDGVSALHRAVSLDWDLDMMKLLMLKGRGMDFDRTEGESPLMTLMNWQLVDDYDGQEESPSYSEESNTLLFLRMGATRKELKGLLWCQLNLPKPPGVLLQTLMDSFSFLPSLSELEAECASMPMLKPYQDTSTDPAQWVCSGVLWHHLEEEMTEEARRQKEESLQAIVAEKKSYYHQRSREVPSLAHLSRAAIRSNLQADVRKVISWPVPQCVKRYILLDHDLRS